MGEGRRGRRSSCSAVCAAACCVLCLLCHHGARCTEQLVPNPTPEDQTLADSAASHAHKPNADHIVQMLLNRYGDGEVVSHYGFEMLLTDLKLIEPSKLGDRQKLVASNSSSSHDKSAHKRVCEGISSTRRQKQSISARQVLDVCPALLVQLAWPMPLWLYATGCIVIISACGLLAVAVIPIMQKMFYQQLLQFLVSLAVGSLCGDALLHLLPHAMGGGHSEEHHSHDSEGHVDVNIWRGFVAMMGIIFFFFTEKCLTIMGEWRRRTQRKKKVILTKRNTIFIFTFQHKL
ncbi:hypothetical protein B566_EDAN007574 [Ephemera danica]|nr:hypothetical protein B566_EDAN007574 [Ephemera danica]